MNDIVYLKLISGEELIGEKIDTGLYANVVQIVPIPVDQDYNFSVRIFPFPFAASEQKNIPINEQHIIIETNPNSNFVDMYREKFGKIQLVQKSFLTA